MQGIRQRSLAFIVTTNTDCGGAELHSLHENEQGQEQQEGEEGKSEGKNKDWIPGVLQLLSAFRAEVEELEEVCKRQKVGGDEETEQLRERLIESEREKAKLAKRLEDIKSLVSLP